MTREFDVSEAERLFAGPGEMRSLMRILNWASTPVGSVDTWPQALKSTIRILLASQYPMVLTWGPEFTQFYNDAYAKLIGSGHPAALGNDIRITLAEGWATLGPMIETVMRTGVANWTPALPLLMERSGYREEAYFSVSHAPAENDDGEIVGMLAVCSEVTSQVVGERRLRLLRELSSRTGDVHDLRSASDALASALLEHPLDLPFGAILLNDSGRFELAADIKCPAHLLETLPIQDVAFSRQSRLVSLDETTAPSGGLWNDPVREVLVLPLEGRRNALVGLLVVGVSPARELDTGHSGFFDLLAQQAAIALRNAGAIEEERRRAEELAALDKAKTDFFSNVSHEFRTPLTLMLGPLEEALSADPASLAQQRDNLDVVYRNALRLLRLVNTLLEFSRVEAHRVDAFLQPTDLSFLTAEIVSSFRSAVDRSGLTLELNLPSLMYPVRVDNGMWEKIVLNLVSNALKHTRAGSISVSVKSTTDTIELAVEDTGTGIAPDELPRIFERFHRVENHQARSFEGTGIGLALVKELVSLHGGTIAAESRPGSGSRFTVSLPTSLYEPEAVVMPTSLDALSSRTYAEEAARWSDEKAIVPIVSSDKPKVLLADDNADMRDYIVRLLSPFCNVTAVGDGEAAIAEISRQSFDLMLSDVMMPKLDGFGVVARLRDDPKTAAIPIVMLSARAGEDARVEGIEAGADDYLVKPFSAKELVARVQSNLELSRMRRKLADAEARVARLEAIGQLTGGVAHDFNNLLTAVTGSLDLLSRRAADRPDLMRFVSLAQAGAARGAKLTGQLLAFARRQPLSPEIIDVNAQLREFLPLLRGAAGDTVELRFSPAATVQSCRVDPGQLEVAVLNLVINAKDASRPNGKVAVAIEERQLRDKVYTCITVTDTGHGMSAETSERAVEPFFTTKDVGAGTGLGLSQVYGFAEQSGGRLEIESQVDVGTVVSIFLPRTRQIDVIKTLSDTGFPQGGSYTVLVVEDEEPVRMIAAEALRDAGYRVIEAANGHEALSQLATSEQIHGIVTDVSMPQGLSGLDLAERVRSERSDMPILLTSGYADALRRNDHGFPLLPKPYSATELAHRVKAMLEGH